MTAVVAPFPAARARGAGTAGRRWSLAGKITGILAFAAAVFLLLTYSQGWELLLGASDDDTSAHAELLRNLFLPAYGASVFLAALAPRDLARGLIRQPFLIALILVAALSLTWSVSPDQTSRRVFALAFTTLSGAALAARLSWARLAEAIAACFAVLALASLVAGLFFPTFGQMTDLFPGAWRGLWEEKNSFGGFMAVGAAVCAGAALLNPRRAIVWWGVALLCVFLLVMSTSKTALLALLAAVGALVLVAAVRRGRTAALVMIWTGGVFLAMAGLVALFAPDLLFKLLGKSETLTGRTDIWAAVIRQIRQRPWLGFGYGAIWEETSAWGPLAWIVHDAGFRPRHAHNAWLEQWLAIGVPGLAAWTGFFLQTLSANVLALFRDKAAWLALPFFVVFSLTSLTESVAVQYNDLRWVIFVALAVKLALPDQPPRSARLPVSAQPRRALGHRHRLELVR